MSAYAVPSWARLWADGREVVYVDAGGVDGPLLVAGATATSPPGDVGLTGGADADLDEYAADLRGRGIARLEVKTDPLDGVDLSLAAAKAGWDVAPIAGSVLVELEEWHRGVMAKNLRRALATAEASGLRGVELRWDHLPEVWECQRATAARTAPDRRVADLRDVERFLFDYEGDWRLFGTLNAAGEVVAADVVLIDGADAANPWGGTVDGSVGPASVVSLVAVLEALVADDVSVVNIGGGVTAGDSLEWHKTRFSQHARVAPAWLLTWAA
jgi:hypothetical protein